MVDPARLMVDPTAHLLPGEWRSAGRLVVVEVPARALVGADLRLDLLLRVIRLWIKRICSCAAEERFGIPIAFVTWERVPVLDVMRLRVRLPDDPVKARRTSLALRGPIRFVDADRRRRR